jgi:hypothetical protein
VAQDVGEFAEYVSFEDFRAGMPAGRFRLVVNPKLARRWVAQRLMLVVLLMPLIGVGIALVLMRQTWPGALLVAAGVLLNRVVMWQAPRIVLHFALQDAKAYASVTQGGVMQVTRAAA